MEQVDFEPPDLGGFFYWEVCMTAVVEVAIGFILGGIAAIVVFCIIEEDKEKRR